jgi:cytokinin dehydrogenase
VAGTIVVGGVGAATSRVGVLADNVLEMQVVTGTGEQVTCSAGHRADLFDAVRAGLGQVGVVTAATLRLMPAPQQVRRYRLIYPDLQTLLHDQRALTEDARFDAVQGAILPTPAGWTYRLDAVKAFSTEPPDDAILLSGLSDDRARAQLSISSYGAYLGRLAALEQALRANGQWFFPHPWLTTFVGDASVESVVTRELSLMTPADLGPLGQIGLSPIRRHAVGGPLLQLPADDLVYAFNFIRIPATDSRSEATRLVAANRAIYERIRADGGTLYPVSAFPMSRDDWRQHFGPAFRQLRQAKRSFDPANILTPGYEVFGRNRAEKGEPQ